MTQRLFTPKSYGGKSLKFFLNVTITFSHPWKLHSVFLINIVGIESSRIFINNRKNKGLIPKNLYILPSFFKRRSVMKNTKSGLVEVEYQMTKIFWGRKISVRLFCAHHISEWAEKDCHHFYNIYRFMRLSMSCFLQFR